MEHKNNAIKSDDRLIKEASDEMLNAINRHFHPQSPAYPTIRATIPAQDTDTDVIVMDALSRAETILRQRDDLLAACKSALRSATHGAEKAPEQWEYLFDTVIAVLGVAIEDAEGGQS